MVKNDIISATKANRLYWLGRYEDRVYMTLHLLNKCYDKMIDGNPDEYAHFWQKLDVAGCYQTNEEFTLGMLYDDENPATLLSAQTNAMNNAILLREDILSETLSYLEMSVALIKKCKEERVMNISKLQPVIDWSLAFWGSAEQRLQNHKALAIMMIGRNVENKAYSIYAGQTYHVAHSSSDQSVDAILRFMQRTDIINFRSTRAGYESELFDENELINISAHRAGIFDVCKGAGAHVKQGELLARILDPYEATVKEEVKAPADSTVFFVHNRPLALEHTLIYRLRED